MKVIIILSTLLSLNLAVYSQTSVFEDSKGESAFKMLGSGATINSKDESIKLSIDALNRKKEKDELSSDSFNRLGINLKLSAKEGIGNLKNSDGFLIDGEIGLYKGWKKTLKPDVKDDISIGWSNEWYITSNLIFNRTKLYDETKNIKDFTYIKSDFGWKFELGNFGYSGNLLYGVNINVGQQNNIKEIKSKTVGILEFNNFNDSVQVRKDISAYDSNEFSEGLWAGNLNADLAYLLNRKSITEESAKLPPMYFAIHWRLNAVELQKTTFNPALGCYFAKSGAPHNIVAGMNIQIIDLFNTKDSDDNTWKRTVFNITAGYQF